MAARLAEVQAHRLALIGLGILLVLFAVAIIGPFLMPFVFNEIPNPDVQVYAGRPPSLQHWFGETRRPAA